jgi:UDP-glucose 4-epimerase
LRHLITGGAGFIGSHLAEALHARGDQVLIVDDFSTGRAANVEHLVSADQVDLVEGDVCDEELVDGCVRDVDQVWHLASAVGVQLVVSRPLHTLQRNIHANDVVISAAARHRKRLLFTSTSEVYGKNSEGPLREDADRVVGSPLMSRWSYSIAKAYGEALCHAYHREEGADTIVVRLFNTVGPRQTGRYGMVLPRFVRQALTGEELTVYGNGTQSRCFAHVADTVHALTLVMDEDRAIGQVFNIGNTVETAVIELAREVIAQAGSASTVRLVPYEEAYDEGFEELGRRQPDIGALRELTGWEPSRTTQEAIDDVIAFERSRLTSEAAASS